MTAKLPKLIAKEKKLLRLPKGRVVSNPQKQSLYTPFVNQLRDAFTAQQATFKKSGAMDHLWREAEVFNKTMIRKLANSVLDDSKYVIYRIIKNNYLKQYNISRRLLGKSDIAGLSRLQMRTVGKVARGITNHTIDKLTQHIYKYGRGGKSLREAKLAVEDLFQNMAEYRPERISRTELARSRNDCLIRTMHSLGANQKQWVLTGKCAEGSCSACKKNAQLGWIPISVQFSSGHWIPPGHPNCGCGAKYKRVKQR